MSKPRTIQKTSKFKKDFKQYQTNKKVVSRLNDILYCLMNRLLLSEQYKNHSLTGEWKGYYDCHVLPNVVLIYTYNDTTVSLTRICTHNKLGLTENLKKQHKLHIKETYELKESNRPNVFNSNSRETYGDLINPNSKVGNVTTHDYYKFEKGKDAVLTYMTADDYIDKCINKVFKSTYAKTITNAIDWDKVNEYAELMKQGTKFPTPYLDYVNAGQEGRHRALAFKQAFGEDAEMPVIELYPSNPTLDEIYDYCTQKWQDGEQWVEYVAPNFGYTTKEIYDYLGKEYIEPEENEEQEDYIDVDIDIDDDDDIDIDEFNEFVKDRSNGEITDVYKLPADEFMKWLTKFTKYYN